MPDHRRPPWEPPPRELLIDRQIREGIEAGKFDDLPYQGQRLPLEDDTPAGEWALAFRMLRTARMAPPWIESDKEVRWRLDERDALLAQARGRGSLGGGLRRRQLTVMVEAANAAIVRLNHEAPTDRQHRRPLDLDAELAALAAAERDAV